MTISSMGYSNILRRENLSASLAAADNATPEGMLEALADMSLYGNADDPGNNYATPNTYLSLQAVVFDGAAGDVYVASSPGFAAWARMLRFNISSGSPSVFREEHQRYPEAQQLSSWYESIYVASMLGDGDGVIAKTDVHREGLTLFEFRYILSAWLSDTSLVNENDMLALADRFIDRYGDFVAPYYYKCIMLSRLGKADETIALCSQALSACRLFPYEEMYLYRLLALNYDQTGDAAAASASAQQCIDLISRYALGSYEKQLIKSMKKLL